MASQDRRPISTSRRIKKIVDYTIPSRAAEYSGDQPGPDDLLPPENEEQTKDEEERKQPPVDLGWRGFGAERVRDYNVWMELV